MPQQIKAQGWEPVAESGWEPVANHTPAVAQAIEPSQTGQQIIQSETGIHPEGGVTRRSVAGAGRGFINILTAPYEMWKAATTEPQTPEERKAVGPPEGYNWLSPVKLLWNRAVTQPQERAQEQSAEIRKTSRNVLLLSRRITGATPAQLADMQKQYPMIDLSTPEKAKQTARELFVRSVKLYGEAVLSDAQNIPIVGAMAQHAGERMAAGDTAGALTETGATVLAPKVIGKAGDIAKAAGAKTFRAVTGTSPKVSAELATKVSAENAAEESGAAEANAKNTQTHLEKTQDALHETEGRELSHAQELRKKVQEIREKDAAEAAKRKTAYEAERERVRQENERASQRYQRKASSDEESHKAAVAEHQHVSEVTSRVNEFERTAKEQLRDTEKKVHDAADQKYETLKPKLYNVEADPEVVGNIVEDALGEIPPAGSEPPLLAKLRKLSENRALTYGDLDSFRSKIGAELRKGTVPSDVYHTLESVQDGLVDEMSRIAGEHGLTEEAGAARAAWREWAEMFRDRKSPFRTILKDPEAHGYIRRLYDRNYWLDRLEKINPTLASGTRLALRDAESIKAPRTRSPLPMPTKPVPPSKPVPPVLRPEPTPEPEPVVASADARAAEQVKLPERVSPPDRPEEVKPNVSTIGPEDIRSAKEQSLRERAEAASGFGGRAARYAIGFRGMVDLYRRSFNLPVDVAAGATGYVGAKGFGALLRNPRVVELLTNPTEADIAQIPPDLRSDLLQVANDAKNRGVAVSASLWAALGVTGMITGEKTRKLQQIRNSYRGNE